MLHYLLQIVIFQLLFLIIYDLFHKKETFFNWNRVYLIATPFLSLLLPFIKIKSFRASTSQVIVTRLERVVSQSSKTLEVIGTSESELTSINWWLVIYFTGLVISCLLLILKLYKLNILKTLSLANNLSSKKIVVLPNSNQAFSFWNTIYLGDALNENEKKRILIHEIVHVEQKHSLDQLYFELLKIAFWWNPLVYYYQSRITELHEYMADAEVIETVSKHHYIEQLLNATFQTQEIKFVNQFFNQSLLKKRILMLQKNKSKTVSKFKYLLIIPVVTGILIYTSCSDVNENDSLVLSSESENNSESNCFNKDAVYDMSKDNFLKIITEKNSEVIIALVNVETKKVIRRAHIEPEQSHTMKNIPEGKYSLKTIYGKGYIEENINGICEGYFRENVNIEANEDIIDFNGIKTKSGIALPLPSYEIILDVAESVEGSEQNTDDTVLETIDASTFACLNKEAIYDEKLDNFLKVKTAPHTEIIVDLINIESGKSIRTIHLIENTKTYMRNVPAGKYKMYSQYGTGYIEINDNGKCMASFENLIEEEKDGPVIDFTPVKTKKGWDVPSYEIILENN